MFIILVYDVGQKRVKKVLQDCGGYLHHIQRSVFEGNLTESQLKKLKKELERLIDIQSDSVCIYKVGSLRYTVKESIGVQPDTDTMVF